MVWSGEFRRRSTFDLDIDKQDHDLRVWQDDPSFPIYPFDLLGPKQLYPSLRSSHYASLDMPPDIWTLIRYYQGSYYNLPASLHRYSARSLPSSLRLPIPEHVIGGLFPRR